MVFGAQQQIAQAVIKKLIIMRLMFVLGAEVTTQQTIKTSRTGPPKCNALLRLA
jgi:hypothetical protein